MNDFIRALIDYGAASVIDFFFGMAIFFIIWSKNQKIYKQTTISQN